MRVSESMDRGSQQTGAGGTGNEEETRVGMALVENKVTFSLFCKTVIAALHVAHSRPVWLIQLRRITN